MTDKPEKIPALFATIHWRSPERPNGYTVEDVRRLNMIANGLDPDGYLNGPPAERESG